MKKFLYSENQSSMIATKKLKAVLKSSVTNVIIFYYEDESVREWVCTSKENMNREFALINKQLNG